MTAAKEKGSRRENETAAAGNKRNTDNQDSTVDTNNHAKGEVFDSSKNNAMNDMAKGAQKSEVSGDMAYVQTIPAQEQTSKGTDSDKPKVNPMMVEEQARTIRAANEEIARPQSSYSNKDNFVLYLIDKRIIA